jgi:hypothetical protein
MTRPEDGTSANVKESSSRQSDSGSPSMLRLGLRSLGLLALFAAAAIPLSFLPNVLSGPPIQSIVPENLPHDQIAEKLKAMSPAEVDQKIDAEKRVLATAPLDQQALVYLSILNGLKGQADNADQIAVTAANRSLRDPASQLNALRVLLTHKNYHDAFYHADALFRSNPDYQSQLFPALLPLMADDSALSAAAETLKNDPPWRKAFLDFIGQNDTSGATLYALFSGIKQAGGKTKVEELRAYLDKMIKLKQFDTAYYVWLDSLSPEELRQVGPLFDSKFNYGAPGRFFDWTIERGNNADFSITQRPGSANENSLRAEFNGSTDNINNVYQYLRLGPGKYRFSAEAMATNLNSAGGLTWRVRCPEDNTVLGEGAKLTTSGPWIDFAFEFSVPEGSCANQILRLESGSFTVLDRQITGQVYYDKFELVSKN